MSRAIGLSIVVPCFNREDTIREAVSSILDQKDLFDIEVIVVDDGSDDASVSKIEDLDVVIIKVEGRGGACAARNVGVCAAKYDWIAFNDSDDLWRKDKLDVVFQHIARFDDDIDYFFHGFLRKSESNSKLLGVYRDVSVELDQSFLGSLLKKNYISTQCLIVRKEVLKGVGLFDVRLPRFQDWELAIRLANNSRGYFIARILVDCLDSTDSISRNYENGILSRSYILKKHRELFRSHPIAFLRFRFDLSLRILISKFVYIKRTFVR